MKQNLIQMCVSGFVVLSGYNYREDKTEDGRSYVEVMADLSFEELDAIREGYNKAIKKDVIRVGIICRRKGQGWSVYDRHLWQPVDAKDNEWSWVYGVTDASGLHVCANKDLDEEEKGWMESAADYEGEEAEKQRQTIAARFADARKKMDDNKVLVYCGLDPANWEVLDRYPTEWETETKEYKVVLLIDEKYNEEHLDCLDDLADYLNGCLFLGSADPYVFVPDWSFEHCCVYTQDDDSPRWTERDWVYDADNEQLMYINDDGQFDVEDKEF